MFKSQMREGGHVLFPPFEGEKHYMVPFWQKEGLPKHLEHWQDTIHSMMRGITTDRPIFLMIDQEYVPAGTPHRRAGVHVDGYWNPGLSSHRGGNRHLPAPAHHRVNRHNGGHMAMGWENPDFSEPEALLLASNVIGCRAYLGEYDGPILEGGDCSQVDLSDLTAVDMMDHRVYKCTVGTLHESLPLMRDAARTVVRLNCPGVFIQ